MTPTEALELVARLRHGYSGEVTPEAAADAIEALARQLAEGPKVRGLEWRRKDDWDGVPEAWAGGYAVEYTAWGYFVIKDGVVIGRNIPDFEAAKSAAEADHRARVLAQLE